MAGAHLHAAGAADAWMRDVPIASCRQGPEIALPLQSGGCPVLSWRAVVGPPAPAVCVNTGVPASVALARTHPGQWPHARTDLV